MADRAGDLFSKSALDKLSSPERLDELVTITNPTSWLALAASLVLVAVLVGWGVLGHVSTRVAGQGILIATGGQVFDAVATTAGAVLASDVNPGDAVSKGQVLATLYQPDLAQKISQATERTASLEQELARQGAQVEQARQARRTNDAARRQALDDLVSAAKQREGTYDQMLGNQERLFAQGGTTRDRVQQLREQLAAARQAVADARTRVLQIDADEITVGSTDARQLAEMRQRVSDARAAQTQLTLQQTAFGQVVSPADGHLLEWKVAPGSYAAAGTSLASIESGKRGLQFVLYVPPDQGKRIRPGMATRIELNGIRKEEWGTLKGRVASVSDFPATAQGMLAVLQNDILVKSFAAQGAPFAARVDLERSGGASGYGWSGGDGPPGMLSSGMTGQGLVTVREQAPASFVLPFLRKLMP